VRFVAAHVDLAELAGLAVDRQLVTGDRGDRAIDRIDRGLARHEALD